MSVIEFYLLGRIPIDVALYFFGVAISAAIVGLSVVRAVVIWSRKASIVVFLLAFVVGASSVIILILGGVKVWQEWENGEYMGFSPFCEA